jgi:predicted dehydrogenase
MDAANDVSIVACADIFKDRMDNCRTLLKERKNNVIADDKCFLGFDAYRKVCALPEVDVVIVASPSLFHPEHLKFAIEQGKHVYCEKPAAIDAVGYRTFMMAAKQAQVKNLNIVTGTAWRHFRRGYLESYRMVQEGYIGRITSGNVYWNQGHMNFARRRPEWTDMEYMFRDFFSWNWLCGDHVIDQLIHNMDVFTWFSHLKPVRVIGMGSRLRRLTGDIYDNFSADIECEGGVHLHAMARQIDDCDNRVCEIIQGTKGSWSSLNGEIAIYDLDGNVIWKHDEEAAKQQFKQHDSWTLGQVVLIDHIRKGKVINMAESLAVASMACIMARESAYSGKAVTWDEITQSDLNLMPAELHLGNTDMSRFKSPLPGVSPLI